MLCVYVLGFGSIENNFVVLDFIKVQFLVF